MSEEEIKKQLESSIQDDKPDSDQPVTAPKPDDKPDEAFHNNLPLEDTLQTYQIMEYFDVPVGQRHSADVLERINTIVTWAKQEAGSRDTADVMAIIRQNEQRFGNILGEQRIFKLYNHIKIQKSIKLLQEREKAIYG